MKRLFAAALLAALSLPAAAEWTMADHARALREARLELAAIAEIQAQMLEALYPARPDAAELALWLLELAAWRREQAAALAPSRAEEGND